MRMFPLGAVLFGLAIGVGTPVNAALVALYTFDDADSFLADSSGNGNTLTNGGGGNPAFTANGISGGAARFDGNNDRFRAAIDVGTTTMPNMTWGAYVLPDDTNGIQNILNIDNGNFDRSIQIEGGVFAFNKGRATGGIGGVQLTTITPSTSDWTFLTATYAQTSVGGMTPPNGTMTFYVNSVAVFTDENTNFNDFLGPTSETFLDIAGNGSSGVFDGNIDSVFVFDEVLTQAQIQGLQLSLPEPAIPGDFDTDEDVDGADFLAWQRDSTVGSLSDWEGNFGAAQAASASQAVPEPTSAALSILAVISLLAGRRQSRSLR